MCGCCFSKPQDSDQPPQQLQIQHGELKNDENGSWPFTEFFLSDLATVTKNFSSEEIISKNGEKSSNFVYGGHFQKNLGFAAIKKFKNIACPDPNYFTDNAKAVGELKHKDSSN